MKTRDGRVPSSKEIGTLYFPVARLRNILISIDPGPGESDAKLKADTFEDAMLALKNIETSISQLELGINPSEAEILECKGSLDSPMDPNGSNALEIEIQRMFVQLKQARCDAKANAELATKYESEYETLIQTTRTYAENTKKEIDFLSTELSQAQDAITSHRKELHIAQLNQSDSEIKLKAAIATIVELNNLKSGQEDELKSSLFLITQLQSEGKSLEAKAALAQSSITLLNSKIQELEVSAANAAIEAKEEISRLNNYADELTARLDVSDFLTEANQMIVE